MKIDQITNRRSAVHCQTEEETMELFKYLDSQGLRWLGGESYLTGRHLQEYGQNTCYNIFEGRFADLQWYKANGYEVYEFSDVFAPNPDPEIIISYDELF